MSTPTLLPSTVVEHEDDQEPRVLLLAKVWSNLMAGPTVPLLFSEERGSNA
jgi:hypothetical protein